MGMAREAQRRIALAPRQPTYSFAARVVLIAMAAIVGAWSLFVYSVLLPSARIDDIGTQIASGESFEQETLTNLQPQISALLERRWLPPQSLRSIALIELRLAELDVLDGKTIAEDPQFELARKAITESLQSSPSDGFMWFALFWLLKTHNGFSQTLVPILRMSYLTAPYEGWIALRRNRAVMPLLPSLPADLAARTVEEFCSLVETQIFIGTAAEILTGPGWPYHNRLIRSLKNVPDDTKQQFDNAVFNLGFNVHIPGVEAHGSRPWR